MSEHTSRDSILALVRKYYLEQLAERPFIAGKTPIPYAGRVFDANELVALVDAALDFWLTSGRFADQLECGLAQVLQVKHTLLCNSGSSANLLALSALTSPSLGERRLVPGDEVVTAAAGFPTTVNPIIQNQLVPVFVDVELGSYNVAPAEIAAAIGPRTRAIVLSHTLGNPFNLDAVSAIAKEHDLWLVEDNCDALGSTWHEQPTGSFGDLATLSFYPAHHITTGEGGAVLTSQPKLKKAVESFRDWGRDCWCDPGKDNTCGKRFSWQLGALPPGYDHKYVYSHIGYNLKMTDLQASIGVAQLEKLPSFVSKRRENFAKILNFLAPWEEFFIMPWALPAAAPSWFGLPLTVREQTPFTRDDITAFLEERRIATRLLFGGNLTRQPAYEKTQYRQVGELANSNQIAQRTFWLGVYPGLTPAMFEYLFDQLHQFLTRDHRPVH